MRRTSDTSPLSAQQPIRVVVAEERKGELLGGPKFVKDRGSIRRDSHHFRPIVGVQVVVDGIELRRADAREGAREKQKNHRLSPVLRQTPRGPIVCVKLEIRGRVSDLQLRILAELAQQAGVGLDGEGGELLAVVLFQDGGAAAQEGLDRFGRQRPVLKGLVDALQKADPGESLASIMERVRTTCRGIWRIQMTLGWLSCLWAHPLNWMSGGCPKELAEEM